MMFASMALLKSRQKTFIFSLTDLKHKLIVQLIKSFYTKVGMTVFNIVKILLLLRIFIKSPYKISKLHFHFLIIS